MFAKKTNNRKMNLRCLIILIGVMFAMCFSLIANDNSSSSQINPNNAERTIPQKRATVERQILGAATQVFEPSLEMKENVEFLLTPALLVQEAISEDIVITYPIE